MRCCGSEGYPVSWPAASLGLPRLTEGGRYHHRAEDIGFSATPLPDYGPATVWATDFRGRDQAVEARFGAHRTRRVVSTRDRFSEGDACFIKLDPRKAFVFSDSGVRLRLEKMSAADRKAMA